jgi:putative heme-binding domain-containing protein
MGESPGLYFGLVLLMAGFGARAAGFDGALPRREALARFALEHDGDPRRGALLFADAGGAACGRCHRVGGEGGEVGPDLSDVGGKYRRADLIEAVLEPSRQVVEGYRPTTLALVDGRVLTGLVRGESAEGLTLVDPEGRSHRVRSGEVEERKTSAASIMPEGLVDRIEPRAFADLIAYLESLRPKPGPAGLDLPPGFSSSTIATGLTGATAMAVSPDGRVFVCEQTGTLRVVRAGGLEPQPFAKFEVDDQWERGLIGVALDPDFVSNGLVYACYVAPRPYPHHRIVRLTAGGGEVVLFEGDDQRQLGGEVPAGHQGGAIHFGVDGKLYVALGDQTAGKPAQDLGTLQGKMLRLDRDGSIPLDNPFASSLRGKPRAIWALGLRNPFTFAVQPETGRIFINDVGGVAEEINEGFAGANYGWPAVEHGPTTDPRFRGPIHHYPTASISGGDFCSRSASHPFPSEWRGRYFFMDFVRGWIKALDPEDPKDFRNFATGLTRPVDLKFAPDGSLLILIRDAWVRDGNFKPGTGSVVKIRHVEDKPPASRP